MGPEIGVPVYMYSSSSSIIKLARVKPKRHLSRDNSYTSPLAASRDPKAIMTGLVRKGWSRSSSFWVFGLSYGGLTGLSMRSHWPHPTVVVSSEIGQYFTLLLISLRMIHTTDT